MEFAAADEQPFVVIIFFVITWTLLWVTAHLNELELLFLKIIHPFIPTPLTLIKMIFFLNLILPKGGSSRVEEGLCVPTAIKQSQTNNVGRFSSPEWSIWGKYKHALGDFSRQGMICFVLGKYAHKPDANASSKSKQSHKKKKIWNLTAALFVSNNHKTGVSCYEVLTWKPV